MMSKRAKISALLWAPAATGIILAVIFRCYSLYPFGDKSLVWCDMRQQVLPFWMQLAEILRGRQDAFYSFQMAGGMEVWGVLFFFAASPFSLLLPFFEKASYVGLANVLTALKMMLCAFGAQWFFLHRHPRLRASLASALAICYAFSGYSLMYFQNSGCLTSRPFSPCSIFRWTGWSGPACARRFGLADGNHCVKLLYRLRGAAVFASGGGGAVPVGYPFGAPRALRAAPGLPHWSCAGPECAGVACVAADHRGLGPLHGCFFVPERRRPAYRPAHGFCVFLLQRNYFNRGGRAVAARGAKKPLGGRFVFCHALLRRRGPHQQNVAHGQLSGLSPALRLYPRPAWAIADRIRPDADRAGECKTPRVLVFARARSPF